MGYQVGDKAPAFSLKDEQGTLHKLADELKKGPVVLIFYPGDMTPGCTKQLCAIRDDHKKFEKLGVVVFGINPAGDDSHQKFIEKYQLTVPLLIDTGLKVSKKYGAIKNMFGRWSVRRSVFVVSPNGKIVYKKRGLPPDSEIIEAIKSIK